MAELFDGKIKQRTYITAPIEKVYDTNIFAKECDKFLTAGMQLEPKPGGKCVFSWRDWGPDFYTLTAPGKVIETVRPSRFVFQWGS